MPHLIWLSPLHGNAVICVVVVMAGVTLTPAVKNGWSFLAYLCEGTGDWRLIRERWGPLLMCEAISSCGPRPLSGDVSLKDMGRKKRVRERLARCPRKARCYLLFKGTDYPALPLHVNALSRMRPGEMMHFTGTREIFMRMWHNISTDEVWYLADVSTFL